ncbi:acyl-CoA dehydrogenase family protein [Polymorphospora rubra]|uniref:acyl-CoA dehydrogenase family protein n=1 Tax=Polymorphospora rubra TaxID=338584 RepID=UPI0031D8A449
MPLFTPEQDKFRAEVCALLCEEDVAGSVARCRRLPAGEEPELLDVYRRLGERGWLAPNWAPEHGGLGATMVEKAILTEELVRHGVPDVTHGLSIDIVGLAIKLLGTDAQRDRLLPGLARGETSAAVLFSEPGVGSDLSSLRTRAEPDGDGGWRLFGRKIFSMKTQFADFAVTAARTTDTGVKYHGITLFLVPLKNLAVTMRPMWNLTEDRMIDVTLDGVRVGADDVLGEVDEGWQTVNRFLGLERTGVDTAAKAQRLLDAVLRHAAATGRLDDPAYAHRLLDLTARVRAARLLAWRCVTNLVDGRADDVQSSTAKWHATEVFKELAVLAPEFTGLDGVLDARDADAPVDGIVDAAYREAPGLTLAAGTSQIMLYVIATQGLELLR